MPWGDCTGPWWMNSGANRAYGFGCCGRGMRMGRGYAARPSFMPASYGVPHQTTPTEEKSYLEDVARRLEEELLLVKERIEKLRSVA
jgi:hypothetical protein